LSAGGVVEGLLAIEDIVEPAEDFFDVGLGERAACGFLFGASGEVIAEGVAAAFFVGGEVSGGGVGGGRGGWGSGWGGGVLSGGWEEEGEGGEEEEERLHGRGDLGFWGMVAVGWCDVNLWRGWRVALAGGRRYGSWHESEIIHGEDDGVSGGIGVRIGWGGAGGGSAGGDSGYGHGRRL
jgi:hypothetical protein